MFNPMTPADVVRAVGQAARAAARGQDADSDFARGQLLSAYSISRHLAVEIESYGPELRAFAADVAGWTRDFGESDPIGALGTQVERAKGVSELGVATCLLLERLRVSDSEAAADLRDRVRARLRRLADREVDLLAAVIEGRPGS